jgi:hypothetical protein
MWRDWTRLRRFWYRGAIKAGVSRHNLNLSDCFQSFSVCHLPSLSLQRRPGLQLMLTYFFKQANTLLQLGAITDRLAMGSEPLGTVASALDSVSHT